MSTTTKQSKRRRELPDKSSRNTINCNLKPTDFVGWSIEKHLKSDKLRWFPSRQATALFFAKGQEASRSVKAGKLLNQLIGLPTLNATVLDWLIGNQWMIPIEWRTTKKGRPMYILFWGTIYQNEFDRRFVRYLCFIDGWFSGFTSVDSDIAHNAPAAMRAV